MKNEEKYKIGYSEDGGIFIGRNIQSDFHKHQSIAIVLSFENPFQITDEHKHVQLYEVAYIPKNVSYKLSTSKQGYTVFIHLDTSILYELKNTLYHVFEQSIGGIIIALLLGNKIVEKRV